MNLLLVHSSLPRSNILAVNLITNIIIDLDVGYTAREITKEGYKHYIEEMLSPGM
jgi:hypothetical protein